MQGESYLHETHDDRDALVASALAAQAPCMAAWRHGGRAPHDERRRRRVARLAARTETHGATRCTRASGMDTVNVYPLSGLVRVIVSACLRD